MNLKTTIFLIILLAAGAGTWYWLSQRQTETPESPTLTFLEDSLTSDKITRIEVLRDKEPRFVLERSGTEWSLPGKWPTRMEETKDLVSVLTSLRSRFAPVSLGDKGDLKPYGLDANPLIVKVTIGDVTNTLRFGEEPGDTNRFTRPTYVRLDDKSEVIRLGPGVLATLDRSREYFQQRRLFPIDRIAKQGEKEKFEQLIASEVEVEDATQRVVLVKKDDDWRLKEAFEKKAGKWEKTASEDRLDPAKLKAFVTAFTDLWAEKFVDKKDKSLDDLGLKEPETTVTVTRTSGAKVKLLVGKIASEKKGGTKKTPPNPFMPPQKEETTPGEEYRYAKLAENDQIFEIKTGKLKDITVAVGELRDPVVARFKPADVKRIEVEQGKDVLVFVKVKDNDKEKWRFEKPKTEDAERKEVEELLDKLADLRVDEKDMLDTTDLKKVGLDAPAARMTLQLEEGKNDKKKARDIVLHFGVAPKDEKKVKEKEKEKAKEKDKEKPKEKDKEKPKEKDKEKPKEKDLEKDQDPEKVYVRVEGWPRINLIKEDAFKLVKRPALAYRQRRILDLAAADVQKLGIERADEKFAFEKKDTAWTLVAPVSADVESSRVADLVSDLAKLEGADLITDAPKDEDLDKVYGLAKPKLAATIALKDSKTPQILRVGNVRDGKQEYYARLDQGPVFTIKKDLRDELDRASLSYRKLQIWKLDREGVTEVSVEREGNKYTLTRAKDAWKVRAPFEADAYRLEAEAMLAELADVRAEKFEAHQAKDLAQYGLDKPAYRISLAGKEKQTLIVGKEAAPGTRFAKVDGSEAIFVVSEKALTNVPRDPFDFLDRTLVSVNPRMIERVKYEGTESFTLEPKGEQWQIVDSPSATFAADDERAERALAPWSGLRAQKFVAYGPKIDWAMYGLDKPAATITITKKSDDKKKPTEHVLDLGKEADGGRYARFDKKDAVVLLDAAIVELLDRSHLDFLDPRVLKFDPDAVTAIQRQMKGADIDLTKREDQWQLTKPSTRDADNLTVQQLLDKAGRLQAKRFVAYPAKDLKMFGLDIPHAIVTLQTETGKHVIKVGDLAKDAKRKDTDERFAIINDSKNVVVLPADLSRHLVGPALYYADRNLASFSGVDTALLERGSRKLTFVKSDAWKVTVPIKADAEDAAIDELIRGLQRLRADEIVAEKGADLKKFGLDQPLLQWHFKSGETEKLHLIVGGLENDKPGARRYARVGKEGPIFLLSPKLTAKLTEEYRTRKPFPAFDAAKTDELTVATPDASFTLRKRGDEWSIVGDAEKKVKSSAVTETLVAISTLKVDHYVVDQTKDVAIYGLAKPAWKITLQTPNGPREILLGSYEGASKRLYATVPESGAVFVLSEADSATLARPLSAYIDAAKKK